ncbi:MAG TPA: circadian clock protein KaiA [Leptolyngbyaceae cyanobacterium]
MSSNLLIDTYIASDKVRQLLGPCLENGSLIIRWNLTEREFFSWTGQNRHRIDCLILQGDVHLVSILDQLKRQGILLPTIVITTEADLSYSSENKNNGGETVTQAQEACLQDIANYHQAVACLALDHLIEVKQYIHQAIDHFLKLPTAQPSGATSPDSEDTQHFVLSLQQQRLTEKLKERLGYLGVYYKRNPEHFLRSMSPSEREEFLQKLRTDYRAIILDYFAKDSNLNQKIDDYVNVAFFADVSVSQIVEIHMELMDEFANQLKLEGRSEEVLLDYRLTLIDVIAHLCEMYRRSVPREL